MTIIFLAAALCAAAGGCSEGPSDVTGTVTYDGQPVTAGAITFIPADDKGRKTGGAIVEGKYHLRSEEQPRPGKYRVEIRWAKPDGTQFRSESGEMLDNTKEALPAKYHDDSQLTAELKSGKNVVNYDLPK
jgi:hypothetical protein